LESQKKNCLSSIRIIYKKAVKLKEKKERREDGDLGMGWSRRGIDGELFESWKGDLGKIVRRFGVDS
jgi:hypothetical protein